MYLQKISLILALVATATFSHAQDVLPKVFMIGDHEQQYEDLAIEYQQTLLTVCENDMKKAFELWVGFSQELEAYAQQSATDINGVKAWFHVFFNANGSIDYLAYHLKPNSRLIDQKIMTTLLTGFVQYYQFPLVAKGKYNNYSSVRFPSSHSLPISNN